MTPTARREVAVYISNCYRLSEHRACKIVNLSLSTKRYSPRHKDDQQLCEQMLAHASANSRYGYRRLHACLTRDGISVNHKKVYRLYKVLGLSLLRKVSKKLKIQPRQSRQATPNINSLHNCWSMDFMNDKLTDGRVLRYLNIVDNYSRCCIAIAVATSIKANQVITILENAIAGSAKPKIIILDNGPEFTSKLFQAWALAEQITLQFISPGKPNQNAYIESFNGKFRDECLNQHWFSSQAEAKQIIAAWQQHYNDLRPHSSLGYLSPNQFIHQHYPKSP